MMVDPVGTDFSDARWIDTEADFEREMLKSIRTVKGSVNLAVNPDIDLKKVFSEFLATYRGFFSNLLEVECKGYQRSDNPYLLVHFEFSYRIGRVKLHMMEDAVNRKIRELEGNLFLDCMPPEIKALSAHNYLVENVRYHNKSDANMLERSYLQSAYGALINGECVCQGFAEAYKMLLDSQGIGCEVICGKIGNSEEGHAWNIVSFDNRSYCHIDVTWDCCLKGKDVHKYYCLSDDELMKDRLWTRPKVMVCRNSSELRARTRSLLDANRRRYRELGIAGYLLAYGG